jgi:uncharacterized membrane protein
MDRVRSETLHLWNVYLEAIYVYERSMPRRETRISEMYISWTGASPRVCASYGRVSFAGMHLKSLHLIGAYISQDVRLRCVYLMGVALSQACVAVPKPPYPNCVPSR